MSRIGTNEDSIALRQQLESIREETKKLDVHISKTMQSENAQDKESTYSQYLQMKPAWKNLYKESLKRESATPIPKQKNPSEFSNQKDGVEITQTNETEEAPIEFEKFNLLQTHNYNSKQEVMQEIIEDRNKKIAEIKEETEEVAKAFALASKLVHADTEKLKVVEENLQATEEATSEGVLKTAQVLFLPVIIYSRLPK